MGGREELPYFSHRLAASSAEMVGAMALGLAASETHREPQEQKTCSPCSSLTWQLVCPGLNRCFLLAGPAHSDMACATHLPAVPPRFLPLLARHMASPDSPCRATRAHPRFSHALHMETGFNDSREHPADFIQIHWQHLGKKNTTSSWWEFSLVFFSRTYQGCGVKPPSLSCPNKPALAPVHKGLVQARGVWRR